MFFFLFDSFDKNFGPIKLQKKRYCYDEPPIVDRTTTMQCEWVNMKALRSELLSGWDSLLAAFVQPTIKGTPFNLWMWRRRRSRTRCRWQRRASPWRCQLTCCRWRRHRWICQRWSRSRTGGSRHRKRWTRRIRSRRRRDLKQDYLISFWLLSKHEMTKISPILLLIGVFMMYPAKRPTKMMVKPTKVPSISKLCWRSLYSAMLL